MASGMPRSGPPAGGALGCIGHPASGAERREARAPSCTAARMNRFWLAYGLSMGGDEMRRTERHGGSPQGVADRRKQSSNDERFFDGRERLQFGWHSRLVPWQRTRCEDCRQCHPSCPQAHDEIHAIEPRHAIIGDQKLECTVLQCLPAEFAINRLINPVSGLLQGANTEAANGPIIVDDEEPCSPIVVREGPRSRCGST